LISAGGPHSGRRGPSILAAAAEDPFSQGDNGVGSGDDHGKEKSLSSLAHGGGNGGRYGSSGSGGGGSGGGGSGTSYNFNYC